MRVIALVVSVVFLSVSQTALAQAPDTRPGPSTPVEVKNTVANPVPVTGTLEVATTNAKPLVVRPVNAEDSALNAFQTRVAFGSGNQQSDKQFAVPAGERLVIQSITVEADIAENQRPEVFLGITFQGKFSVHYLPVTSAGRDAALGGSRDVFMGLHQTRFFADGGTIVTVVCRPVSFAPTNTCGVDMSVSGYLVPMP